MTQRTSEGDPRERERVYIASDDGFLNGGGLDDEENRSRDGGSAHFKVAVSAPPSASNVNVNFYLRGRHQTLHRHGTGNAEAKRM